MQSSYSHCDSHLDLGYPFYYQYMVDVHDSLDHSFEEYQYLQLSFSLERAPYLWMMKPKDY